jgi:hypothetical protein
LRDSYPSYERRSCKGYQSKFVGTQFVTYQQKAKNDAADEQPLASCKWNSHTTVNVCTIVEDFIVPTLGG